MRFRSVDVEHAPRHRRPRHRSAALVDLRKQAEGLGGDPTGWDEIGPGEGFSLDGPPPGRIPSVPTDCRVRFCQRRRCSG